jgi:hypothetical protein
MLGGVGHTGLLGQNVTGASTSAESEALNNALEHVHLGPVHTGKPAMDADNGKAMVTITSPGPATDEMQAGNNPAIGQVRPVGIICGDAISPKHCGPIPRRSNVFYHGQWSCAVRR